MTLESVNLLALIAAVIANMAIGFLWYSPVLFAKPWMMLMGYTAESLKKAQQEMGMMYMLSAVAALVTSFILAQLFKWLMPETLIQAMSISFMMWLGFIAPVQFTDVLFGKRPMNLFLINTGYQLTSMLGMAVALYYLG